VLLAGLADSRRRSMHWLPGKCSGAMMVAMIPVAVDGTQDALATVLALHVDRHGLRWLDSSDRGGRRVA
jgi:phosphoribosyl-AMP cyclohydrolase